MTTIKTNKEINDIFSAMDNLTKNELAMAELDPGCCPNEDECECAIPFCCTMTLPQGFEYAEEQGNQVKFAITKCCLRKINGYCDVTARVQDICNMPVTLSTKVLVERVFGSIHYIVSVDGVMGDCGITLTNDGMGNWIAPGTPPDYHLSATDNKTSAFYNGYLCIDKIINLSDNQDKSTCPLWDQENELDCTNFKLIDFEVITEDCDPEDPTPIPPYACNQVIKIRGKLRLVGLPECCPEV